MITLRDCGVEDYPCVLALNTQAIPKVNLISLLELRELALISSYFRVACDGRKIVGTLLVIPSKQKYASLNYTWFNTRYDNFQYVDRVIVDKKYIGRGIGTKLYDDLLVHPIIDQSVRYIACEINIKPMNERSLSFHSARGFVEVGQRDSDADRRVSLLMKKIDRD